jgi:hypothetical protein
LFSSNGNEVGGSIGEVTVPVIVGWLVVKLSSSLLLWSLLIISLLLFALYALILYTLAHAMRTLQKSNITQHFSLTQQQQQQCLLEKSNDVQCDNESEMQPLSAPVKTNHLLTDNDHLHVSTSPSVKSTELSKKVSNSKTETNSLRHVILNPVS